MNDSKSPQRIFLQTLSSLQTATRHEQKSQPFVLMQSPLPLLHNWPTMKSCAMERTEVSKKM